MPRQRAYARITRTAVAVAIFAGAAIGALAVSVTTAAPANAAKRSIQCFVKGFSDGGTLEPNIVFVNTTGLTIRPTYTIRWALTDGRKGTVRVPWTNVVRPGGRLYHLDIYSKYNYPTCSNVSCSNLRLGCQALLFFTVPLRVAPGLKKPRVFRKPGPRTPIRRQLRQ